MDLRKTNPIALGVRIQVDCKLTCYLYTLELLHQKGRILLNLIINGYGKKNPLRVSSTKII